MNKPTELTVTINANLGVDRKTAETCLKIVELYINQNGLDVIGRTEPDGTVSFSFGERL